MTGKVFLVGAGPGSPDLITVRGLQRVQAADAVVHDRLVDRRLVALARSDAEIFEVGKTAGGPSWAQEDINGLLIALVRQGKQVVRLKGGDPFVFGRGGEEQAALRAAQCAVEVVPGVSSATGVPAALGVPLTHRGLAADFAVLTGQTAPECLPGCSHWGALAQLDTLVVLMGFGAVSDVQQGLLTAGKSPDTPVLLVSAGTWPGQQAKRTSLEKLVQAVEEGEWTSPSLMIIGNVVQHWSGLTVRPQVQHATVSPARETDTGTYPIALTHMRSRTVLVVGGGTVGTRKCLKLLGAGAQVVLCSPAITDDLKARIEAHEMTWRARGFRSSDLEGMFLVFAATNDVCLNRDIARLAAQRNILCNVATDPDEGDFWVPALARIGACTVAVSSRDGKPRTAQHLRDQIEALWLLGDQEGE